jgi:hypothetical protein
MAVEREGDNVVIEAGVAPSFVVGLNEALVRWKTMFAFRNTQMPSRFGAPLANGFHVVNTFDHDVQVKVRLTGPSDWKFTRQEFEFSLAPEESSDQAFEVVLPIGASHGAHPIQIEFDIEGESEFHFSMARTLEVGTGSMGLLANSHLDEEGFLVVEQRLNNLGDRPIQFRCHLSAPARRRIRRTVKVSARGEIVTTYRLAEGRELLGKKLSIRAEEIGGAHMLNVEFTVGE